MGKAEMKEQINVRPIVKILTVFIGRNNVLPRGLYSTQCSGVRLWDELYVPPQHK